MTVPAPLSLAALDYHQLYHEEFLSAIYLYIQCNMICVAHKSNDIWSEWNMHREPYMVVVSL